MPAHAPQTPRMASLNVQTVVMPFVGFEGPAGTGKTYELIEDVRRRIGAPEWPG